MTWHMDASMLAVNGEGKGGYRRLIVDVPIMAIFEDLTDALALIGATIAFSLLCDEAANRELFKKGSRYACLHSANAKTKGPSFQPRPVIATNRAIDDSETD